MIFEHFGPYHFARLRAASRIVDVLPIELFGKKNQQHAWDANDRSMNVVDSVILPDQSPSEFNRRRLRGLLESKLDQLNPDCVAVHGWSLPGAATALKWALDRRVPTVVMSESKWDDSPRYFGTEMYKKQILGSVSAGLVGAKHHKDYLAQLGIPEKGIFFGYDAVDNEYFSSAASVAAGQSDMVRQRFGLPEKYFFASARFVQKKNHSMLIAAYKEYIDAAHEPWHLVLAGDGPLSNQIRNQVVELRLDAYVTLAGHLSYDVLPAYYSLASALVHVSKTEQWGLVVNEAMACGLPVIVSKQSGCAPELVDENENGFLVDANDRDSIASALKKMSSLSSTERQTMSRVSEKLVAKFSPAEFGQGLYNACQYAIENSRFGNAASRIMHAISRTFGRA